MVNIRKLDSDLWEFADLLQGRLQTDLQPILYAGTGPDFSALCLQPLQAGRAGDSEKPPCARQPGHACGGQ